MERARLDDLWERRLAGETLTGPDEQALLQALSADPALREELIQDERLDATLAAIVRSDRDAEEFLDSFRHRISLEDDADRFARKVAPRLRTRRALARPAELSPAFFVIAAALLLLLAAFLLRDSSEPATQVHKPARDNEPRSQAERSPEPGPLPRPPGMERKPPVEQAPEKKRERVENELEKAIPPKPEPVPEPPPRAEPPKKTEVTPTPAPKPTRTVIARLERSDAATTTSSEFAEGDLVESGAAGPRIALVFSDKTRIEFGPDSRARDVSIESGKKLTLEKGSLRAEVARQPKDQPLMILTPHGDAKVVGTTLRVFVDPDPRKGTRLEVEEGKVEFRNTAKKSVTVEGGQFAVAATGVPLAAKRPPVSFELDLARPQLLKPRFEFGEVVQTPQGPVVRSTPNQSTLWSSEIGYWAGSEDVITFTLKKSSTLRFRYFLKNPSEINFRIKNLTKREYFTLDFNGVVGQWTTVSIPVLEIPVITEGLKVACEPGDKYGRFSFLVGTPQQRADIDIAEFRILEIER